MRNSPKSKLVAAFAIPFILAVGIVISLAVVRAQDGGSAKTASEAGLTDAQRDELHKTAIARTVDNQIIAVREFIASGVAISSLPRVSFNTSSLGSQYDVSGATAAAVEVVRGKVTKQRLTTLPDQPAVTQVVSTISVTEEIKGHLSLPEIDLVQAGSPVLRDDGSYALAIHDDDPIVTPGDDVIVFAAERAPDGAFTAMPYKILKVESGLLLPNPYDYKATAINGKSVEEVLSAIRAAAGQ
jgi:hypothetical protein